MRSFVDLASLAGVIFTRGLDAAARGGGLAEESPESVHVERKNKEELLCLWLK
jgi:hypothetical protein